MSTPYPAHAALPTPCPHCPVHPFTALQGMPYALPCPPKPSALTLYTLSPTMTEALSPTMLTQRPTMTDPKPYDV